MHRLVMTLAVELLLAVGLLGTGSTASAKTTKQGGPISVHGCHTTGPYYVSNEIDGKWHSVETPSGNVNTQFHCLRDPRTRLP